MPMDLLGVPAALSTALGLGSTLAGGIIATILFTCLILFPIMYLTKGRAINLYLIMSLMISGFTIAINWLPSFFIILMVLIVSMGLASKYGGVFK